MIPLQGPRGTPISARARIQSTNPASRHTQMYKWYTCVVHAWGILYRRFYLAVSAIVDSQNRPLPCTVDVDGPNDSGQVDCARAVIVSCTTRVFTHGVGGRLSESVLGAEKLCSILLLPGMYTIDTARTSRSASSSKSVQKKSGKSTIVR